MNRVVLAARLAARSELRYTPAGIAVADATLAYDGVVVEAEVERTLRFEVEAVALGMAAQRLMHTALGAALRVNGFLAPRTRRSRRLVLHITDLELDSTS